MRNINGFAPINDLVALATPDCTLNRHRAELAQSQTDLEPLTARLADLKRQLSTQRQIISKNTNAMTGDASKVAAARLTIEIIENQRKQVKTLHDAKSAEIAAANGKIRMAVNSLTSWRSKAARTVNIPEIENPAFDWSDWHRVRDDIFHCRETFKRYILTNLGFEIVYASLPFLENPQEVLTWGLDRRDDVKAERDAELFAE